MSNCPCFVDGRRMQAMVVADGLTPLSCLSLPRQALGMADDDCRLPQLVICGHGSVDDPDGTWVSSSMRITSL